MLYTPRPRVLGRDLGALARVLGLAAAVGGGSGVDTLGADRTRLPTVSCLGLFGDALVVRQLLGLRPPDIAQLVDRVGPRLAILPDEAAHIVVNGLGLDQEAAERPLSETHVVLVVTVGDGGVVALAGVPQELDEPRELSDAIALLLRCDTLVHEELDEPHDLVTIVLGDFGDLFLEQSLEPLLFGLLLVHGGSSLW